MNWKIGLMLVVLGAGASFGVTHWRDNAKIVAVQQRSDSLVRDAATRDSAQAVRIRTSDSTIAALAKKKSAAAQKEAVATAGADTLAKELALVKTAADSIPLLTGEVAQLRIAKAQADSRADIAESESKLWMFRALSSEKDVRELHIEIVGLNEQIQALNSKTLPKWLDFGLTWGTRVLAVKGAYDTVKGK